MALNLAIFQVGGNLTEDSWPWVGWVGLLVVRRAFSARTGFALQPVQVSDTYFSVLPVPHDTCFQQLDIIVHAYMVSSTTPSL